MLTLLWNRKTNCKKQISTYKESELQDDALNFKIYLFLVLNRNY